MRRPSWVKDAVVTSRNPVPAQRQCYLYVVFSILITLQNTWYIIHAQEKGFKITYWHFQTPINCFWQPMWNQRQFKTGVFIFFSQLIKKIQQFVNSSVKMFIWSGMKLKRTLIPSCRWMRDLGSRWSGPLSVSHFENFNQTRLLYCICEVKIQWAYMI